MSAGLNPQDPRQLQIADLLRLFDAQALGVPQTFSGTSGTIVEPPPPQSLFQPNGPPPRGVSAPSGEALVPPATPPQAPPQPEVPAPQAVAPDAMPAPAEFTEAPPPPPPMPATTGSVPQPMPPRMPIQGPQPPQDGRGGFLSTLARPDISNLLIGIGSGLMSKRGFGPGLAEGLGNAAQLNRQQKVNELADAELAMKRYKLGREQLGENATYKYLLDKGMSPEAATSAVMNPTVLTSILSQMNKAPDRVVVGGKIYELRPGERPSEANLIGDAGEPAKPQLGEIGIGPNQIQKAWIKPDGTHTPVGDPYDRREPKEDEYTKEAGKIQARHDAVVKAGGDPKDPQNAVFIASGRYPKEDQQRATATDKKMINDSEDKAVQLDNTISTLKSARDLNYKTFNSFAPSMRGYIGSSIPDEYVPDWVADRKGAEATREFGQIMSMEAIKSMADTLAGATTDREMGRFLEILSDPTSPPDLRERTINRMIKMAEDQKVLAKARAEDVRGGAYFQKGYDPKVGAGSTRAPQPQPQPTGPVDVQGSIANARKALAGGAPRAVVEQRLRDAGIDPSGL